MYKNLSLLIAAVLLCSAAVAGAGAIVDVNSNHTAGVHISSGVTEQYPERTRYWHETANPLYHEAQWDGQEGVFVTGGLPAYGCRPLLWKWDLSAYQYTYEIVSDCNITVGSPWGAFQDARFRIYVAPEPWEEQTCTYDSYVGDADWQGFFGHPTSSSWVGKVWRRPPFPPVGWSDPAFFDGEIDPNIVQNWLDHPGANNGVVWLHWGFPIAGCYVSYGGSFVGTQHVLKMQFKAEKTLDLPYGANPPSGSSNVPPYGLELSWQNGLWALYHDVYFGTDWNDVNEATTISDPNNVYKDRQDFGEKTYAPDANIMDYGKTYYWRIDEVNGTTGIPYKGKVWYFNTADGKAHEPVPRDGAFDLEGTIELSWTPGPYAALHDIYIGENEANVCDANIDNQLGVYVGRQSDPCYPFAGKPAKSYYWRIDEVNEAGPDPCLWPGDVWSFTMLGSTIALFPHPANGVTVPDLRAVTLGWRPGDWIQTTAGHHVYFGTDVDEVNDANTSVHPNVTVTIVDNNNAAPPALEFDTTYHWRVDEVNDPCLWRGDAWHFLTPTYILLDDFSYDDINGLLANWEDGDTYIPTCTTGWSTSSNITLSGGTMVYDYNNNGVLAGRYNYSEIMRHWPGGTDFTEGSQTNDCKALYVDFQGLADNNNHPTYDIMYIVLEDTAGGVAHVNHPDPNAQATYEWQQWNISLSDFTPAVDVTSIEYMYIGFGERCNSLFSGNPGGAGTVTFDNLRLYPARCVPELGPNGDLTDDCIVNTGDLEYITDEWLNSDGYITFEGIVPPASPVLWYKFDEGGGNDANDSTVLGYDGHVKNDAGWHTSGGFNGNGYLYLDGVPDGTGQNVEIPNDVFANSIGENMTISTWIRVERDDFPQSQSWQPFIRAGVDPCVVMDIWLPTPSAPVFEPGPQLHYRFIGPPDGDEGDDLAACWQVTEIDFTSKWHHYALVKDGTNDNIAVYHNGELVCDANDANNIGEIPTPYPITLGCFGPWGGGWAGGVDDFRIYSYALSEAEIQYIATNGTGSLYQGLDSPADLYVEDPNIINFKDLSIMGGDWLDKKYWPVE